MRETRATVATHNGYALTPLGDRESTELVRGNEWLSSLEADLRDKVGVAQIWSTQRLRRSPIHALILFYKYMRKGV